MGLDHPYSKHDLCAEEKIHELRRRARHQSKTLRVLEKNATWWGGFESTYPPSHLGHVAAADHPVYRPFVRRHRGRCPRLAAGDNQGRAGQLYEEELGSCAARLRAANAIAIAVASNYTRSIQKRRMARPSGSKKISSSKVPPHFSTTRAEAAFSGSQVMSRRSMPMPRARSMMCSSKRVA